MHMGADTSRIDLEDLERGIPKCVSVALVVASMLDVFFFQ